MKKIIVVLLVLMLAIVTSIAGSVQNISESQTFADPPKNFTWFFNRNDVADWWHATVVSGDQNGCVEGIEDTGGDGKIGKCDYVVVNWHNSNVRQPFYKYHIKDSKYITEGPNEGMWSFEFDYKSKSRLAPLSFEKAIYVDDDNTAGPWDGSYYHPFHTIQDALDEAIVAGGDDWDVVIEPGDYSEGVLQETMDTERSGWWADFRDDDYPSKPVVIGGATSEEIAMILKDDYTSVCGLTITGGGDCEECAGLIINSDHCEVIGCDIHNAINGIYLTDSANHNTIVENHIHDNDFGLFINFDSNDNLIYNNNLMDNDYFNAKDLCSNYWYYDYPIGGNYWDDYDGVDLDGDGIGDTPYIYPIGFITDGYPLMDEITNSPPTVDINGKQKDKTGEEYTVSVMFYDDEYHDGAIKIDWDDGSDIEWSEYLGADQEYIFEHIWSQDGTYNIKVRAVDMFGAESEWGGMEVKMPKKRSFEQPMMNLFLEKLFILFPWLEKII